MLPQNFIDQLLSHVDIVDVIERYIPLKKGGQNSLACCPFHKEKTPSFTVSPSKQFYYCFGCGAHGSAIGFIMAYQGLEFVDAVKYLAASVGLAVPHSTRGSLATSEQGARRRLSEVLGEAARYYTEQLHKTQHVLEYCQKRGIKPETIEHFALGYAPAHWQNLAALFDYQDSRLQESGLVIEKPRLYDRFRDRLIFPIRNLHGAIIGFGGRVLGNQEPKYLNSPTTALFEKGRELYGLYEARQSIRTQNRIIVVEGYMDVVSLAQSGIDYAVATLGTATTSEQVRKLIRQADHIYFCFDGDTAGAKAAWRALENSLPQLQDGKSLYFLFLPPQHDPDSYVCAHGAAAFKALLEEKSLPLSSYFTQTLSEQIETHTPEGRAALLKKATSLLAKIAAPAFKLIIKKRLAQLAGIDVEEFDSVLQCTPTVSVGRQDYTLPTKSTYVRHISIIRKQLMWLLMNPAWADDVQLPDSITLGDELACFAMLTERILSFDQTPSTAQLLEGVRSTPYETLLNGVLQHALQNPEECAAPTEEDRQQFREGNQKMLRSLANVELEKLKQKSKNERLTLEETQRMCQLVSRK